MKKKISIILTICMLVSMVPTFAFANVDTNDTTSSSMENDYELNIAEEIGGDVGDEGDGTENDGDSTEGSGDGTEGDGDGTEGDGTEDGEDCTHEWFLESFVWETDYSACKAVVGCFNCEDTREIYCAVTKEQTKKPTCKATGEYTYTATTAFGEESYTDTKYETIPKTAHKYSGNKCSVCGVKLLATPVAKATKYSYSKIKVSWKKVANASGYYIYRATSKYGKYTCIKTASSGSTYYIDSNRTAGKTYYYKVCAYKGSVKSTASSITSAASGLLMPKMKTYVTSGKSTITVSWNKVAYAKGYLVYRKTPNGSWKKVATIKSGSTLKYKNTSVPGGYYYYAVKAYGKVNGKTIYSSLSSSIKTRTLKTPTFRVADYDPPGDDLINKVVWSSVTGATGYEIYYKNGSNGTWKLKATVGKTTYYYDKKVGHGYYRYYKVRAIYSSNGVVSKGGFSKTDNTMWYYSPNVSTFMLDDADSSCSFVPIIITNKGVGKLRVYSAGARLLDHDYYSYDRNVKLYNDDIKACSYIDVPVGKSVTMGFAVVGSDTWYDKKSKLKFKVYYDGVYYWCYASSYYGFSYYEID